ncbi:MAG: TMEM165/GDT1 family protein [Idiomarina sp.]|nr:TMEM165/GDT1 family protein [Idiomarina sp.]
MDAFFLSILTVGIAEVGDRSLFLALLFGLRYQRPWPVFAGMALGLFLNQALSALVGMWLFQFLQADWHGWLVGIAFLVMAVWVLVPEQDDELKADVSKRQLFLAAAVGFFVLEMADKTQLVVVTLAGSYQTFWPVVLGATIGILAVTTPALWLGYKFANRIPLQTMKWVACGLFLVLGVWVLLNTAGVVGGAANLNDLLPAELSFNSGGVSATGQ